MFKLEKRAGQAQVKQGSFQLQVSPLTFRQVLCAAGTVKTTGTQLAPPFSPSQSGPLPFWVDSLVSISGEFLLGGLFQSQKYGEFEFLRFRVAFACSCQAISQVAPFRRPMNSACHHDPSMTFHGFPRSRACRVFVCVFLAPAT